MGAGAASADPYLLRRFSKPTPTISWRRKERTAGCESVWSAKAAPTPREITCAVRDGYKAAVINYGFLANAVLTTDNAVKVMR